MGFYVIGIGGTGAKCIEAIIQLASLGLFPTNKLNILFVDADETNGNLQQSQNSLSFYQKCYGLLKGKHEECNWMTTNIESYPVWSPFARTGTDKNLGSFFSYSTIEQANPTLAHLFDVLYTEDERKVSLEVGFRGRPAIGAGIMTQIDLERLDEPPWSSFISQINNDAGGGADTKVLLCGSIFGGTGASGLPTIGRLIANKLDKDGVRNKVKLGCIFALPYFNFPRGTTNEVVYATSDLFLLNTEAALRYYNNHADQFDVKYLIGNQQFEQLGDFHVGKENQKNRPHFVELYAALAARNFFCHEPPDGVNVISRKKTGVLQWDDLPNTGEIKTELTNAARFAFIWLADFEGKLENAKAKGIKELDGFDWFDKFFQGPKGLFGGIPRKHLPNLSSDEQQEAIKIINDWCRDFLRWLFEIHQCENEKIQLFKAREHFVNLNSLKEEKLANLFFNDPRGKDLLDKDNLVNLKNTLGDLDISTLSEPNQGVAGLAKALYVCCKL